MGRRLAAFVHVAGQRFAPGDVPPENVAALIRNPACWEDDAAEAEPVAAADIPPKAGAGSSKSLWRAYADRNGVEVPADASRDEIVDACAAAGVPTE